MTSLLFIFEMEESVVFEKDPAADDFDADVDVFCTVDGAMPMHSISSALSLD